MILNSIENNYGNSATFLNNDSLYFLTHSRAMNRGQNFNEFFKEQTNGTCTFPIQVIGETGTLSGP